MLIREGVGRISPSAFLFYSVDNLHLQCSYKSVIMNVVEY